MTLFIISWLVIGYIFFLASMKLTEGEVCVKHFLIGIPCSIACLVFVIIFFIELIENHNWEMPNWMNKRIF
jgi:hypothetical protein